MEFIGLYVALSLGIGIALWYWVRPRQKPVKQKSAGREPQMLFMGEALNTRSKLMWDLDDKISKRSLEIARSDNRFLVTPNDMKQAYNEIIREEHM